SLLKNAWRWKELQSARRVEDGGDEPHGARGRQRKWQKVCQMFRGRGAAEVVAPAFLVDGSRCGGRRKERLASLRAAWPGAGIPPGVGRNDWLLLNGVSAGLAPDGGRVLYRTRHEGTVDIYEMSEAERRLLMRTDWGLVHQNPRDGLRLGVTAGANIGERLM